MKGRSTVNLLGQYVLSDSCLVVHLISKRAARACTAWRPQMRALRGLRGVRKCTAKQGSLRTYWGVDLLCVYLPICSLPTYRYHLKGRRSLLCISVRIENSDREMEISTNFSTNAKRVCDSDFGSIGASSCLVCC